MSSAMTYSGVGVGVNCGLQCAEFSDDLIHAKTALKQR